MKKYKKYLFSLLLFLSLILLCSCRCEPSEYEWHLYEITEDVSFSNGATEKISVGGHLDIYQPYARAYAERCLIEFSDDGRATMSLDGEELSGTYTYKHNGFRDTSFTVNLENGEHFSGTSVSYYGGSELKFEFRGTSYEFTEYSSRPVTKEDEALEWLVEDLRGIEAGEINGRFGDFRGEITLSGEDYVLTAGDESYNLSSKDSLVWCSLLDKENKLSHLSEIRLGSCYFLVTNYVQIGEPGEQKTGQVIVIYYIEPLPEEPGEPQREEKALTELYPWILGEISSVKLTREFTNLPAGYKKYHDYLTADEAGTCLEALRRTKLCEVYFDELEDYFLNGEMHELITLIADTSDGKYEIQFVDGLIFDGERWWNPDTIPSFSYDGATESFILYKDEIRVFDRDGKEVGVYLDELSKIEFVICDDEHNYSTLTPYFRVVAEFGEITVYDANHFWYKGQSYVAVGENNFEFLFCADDAVSLALHSSFRDRDDTVEEI